MATALPLITKAPFISKHDKDKPGSVQVIWMLQPLTGLQHMEITASGFTDYSGAIMMGLKGWKNFKDAAGAEVEFSFENIARIPALYLQDIAFEILKRSSLDEEKTKNS